MGAESDSIDSCLQSGDIYDGIRSNSIAIALRCANNYDNHLELFIEQFVFMMIIRP
jgi:hypothetical protein